MNHAFCPVKGQKYQIQNRVKCRTRPWNKAGLEGHDLVLGLGTHARLFAGDTRVFEVMYDSTKQAFAHALCVEHRVDW